MENKQMKRVQVREATGYPKVAYFCQSFREYFGISPQKFRNQGEEVIILDETNLEMD